MRNKTNCLKLKMIYIYKYNADRQQFPVLKKLWPCDIY